MVLKETPPCAQPESFEVVRVVATAEQEGRVVWGKLSTEDHVGSEENHVSYSPLYDIIIYYMNYICTG